jgi:hypothetical protein
MKKISPYIFTTEEKKFLFYSKRNNGESTDEANLEIEKDKEYLRLLKKKNKKAKRKKLNFKLCFEEITKK